ncbi:(2Fe-2S)-binding protein [Kitasatospora sp. NPDC047058]|uniref:(2Fe-2S)-binding protein n=1 Tax=Kitasatospora sp. NPDC047058 TaxID=3155620 RepID=UPI0033D4E064
MTVSSSAHSGTAHCSTPVPAAPDTADPVTAGPDTAAGPPRTADGPQPCAASYRRLGELFPALRVHCAPPRRGDGWLTGADLAARPEALRELIAHDARDGLARYGRPLRPDVAAGFGLHRFTWPAGLLFTLPWFLERRVPLLAPADVSVRRRTGELTARPGAFACLPDDPAAGLPDARPVAGEPELAAVLRSALAGFLTPLLEAFRPEVRRGPRMLWAMATDAVVEGLWYVGGLLGEEERARTELSGLLAPEPTACAPGASVASVAPFTPGAGFAPVQPDASTTDRGRASCCLVYTVQPGGMCRGCPRVTRG